MIDDRRDTMSLAWVPADCEGIINNTLGDNETSFDCGPNFASTFFETIVGHPGPSFIFGTGWGEEIHAGGGDDKIFTSWGRDVVGGGPGWDYLVVGEEAPRPGRPERDEISGEGRKDFSGIEGLFSVNDDPEVFAGEPPAQLDSVSGGDGPNVLNLGASSHGVSIIGVNGIQGGPLPNGPVLFADGFEVLGSPFADRMRGDPDGVSGDDVFRGRGGGDRLVGGVGDDTLTGGEGDDTIAGEGGDDVDRRRSGERHLWRRSRERHDHRLRGVALPHPAPARRRPVHERDLRLELLAGHGAEVAGVGGGVRRGRPPPTTRRPRAAGPPRCRRGPPSRRFTIS